MMDWNAYRAKLMAGFGDLQAMSPDTVGGYVQTSGVGAKPITLTARPAN